MKKMFYLKILFISVFLLLTNNLISVPCYVYVKPAAYEWDCPDGNSSVKYTCKTIEWDEEINGVIIHNSKIVLIYYCCNWDETLKTLNTTIMAISYLPGYSNTKPTIQLLLDNVSAQLLEDTKIHCFSSYPPCDDPNIPKKYEHKITFPTCWYYKNHQPFIGDDFVLSLIKCAGSSCNTTYEVCTDYSQIPYKIVYSLVSKQVEGNPCSAGEPVLPPDGSPLWFQLWSTECFLFNHCN
jgi:hypothetical protein